MKRKPVLSIIVCTYNRAIYIETTLLHLIRQEIDKNLIEVLIINNKSTDDTEQRCHTFIQQHPEEPIRYFLETRQGHSYCRNRGIHESAGNLLAFIDDDAFVDKSFSSHIIRFFNQHPKVQAIGGKILPEYESEEPSWMSRFLLPLVSALDMGEQVRPFKGRKFPVGANITFRKQVFDQYGLFNVELGRKGTGLAGGDEKELIFRLKADHALIFYVPDVVVKHVIPAKRLTKSYIKGLAVGVGESEKERLKNKPLSMKLIRAWEELYKIGATVVLCILYGLTFQFPKAFMLVQFRIWVIKGFFNKSNCGSQAPQLS